MRRASALALLLVVPALAGCAAPSGVNERSYPQYVTPPPVDPPVFEGDADFVAAMRAASRPRAPLADEEAYDRFLDSATRWAREGLGEADAAAPFDAESPEARSVFAALAGLRVAPRGSDKEVLSTGQVRTALALRHNLTRADADVAAIGARLLEAARADVERANATVHEARGRATEPGRNALLRAEAVLGLALTDLASAEDGLATAGGEREAALAALEARVSAAAVLFWIAEADAASASSTERPAFLTDPAVAADLLARAEGAIADAENAISLARNATAEAQPVASDLAIGVRFVRALAAAGLPEGAWAASQGLQENLLVTSLVLAGSVPSDEEVRTAWDQASASVRTFRDAQRYDRALAIVDEEPTPLGGAVFRLNHLRAFAAVALMRSISEERESLLSPTGLR